MANSLQIRNIPPALHKRLKARAALEGVSMSRYALRQIERALERPTRRELIEALRSQPKIELDPSPAEIIREERDRL